MAANNIANVKTSGYKPKRLVKTTFDQQLVREMNGRTEGLGQGSTISVGTREMTTHGQGPIEDTGKTYDLAINGDGFFVIQLSLIHIYCGNHSGIHGAGLQAGRCMHH